MQLSYCYMASPVGQLKLVANEQALVAILWDNENPKRVRLAELIEDVSHPILLNTQQQLIEYFSGQRKVFDILLDFEGTDFQKQVWNSLLAIPYGKTMSYLQEWMGKKQKLGDGRITEEEYLEWKLHWPEDKRKTEYKTV